MAAVCPLARRPGSGGVGGGGGLGRRAPSQVRSSHVTTADVQQSLSEPAGSFETLKGGPGGGGACDICDVGRYGNGSLADEGCAGPFLLCLTLPPFSAGLTP